jgi:dual specificity tyrosine-phosphorylation-regulated kinase 2/3/4
VCLSLAQARRVDVETLLIRPACSPRSSSFGASAETPSSTSRNTPSSAFPMTPDPPSPSNIDRRGLVGVGELATPRWSQSTGPGSSWSQPHPWQDSGAGSSSWDYRGTSATAERNRSWGELASEALADSQSAAAGVVRIGKSESHLLGQHARGLAAGSDRGLGLDPQEVLALSPSPRMPPALLSSYDLKRDPLAEDAQPTPVSPLTSNDTASSSFFAPAAESAQTYAAGLLAADAAATAPAAIPASSVAGPSSSPRAHRRRPSDQFKLSFGATDAESKAPLREKSTAGGLDLTPWERHVPPVGTVASPPSADAVAAKPSPTTATSSGAEAGGRKSRERRHSSSKPTTPSSPGHDIVRQFSASHDFSHLPPSPSSSSIQRFIRQSSVSNLSAASAAAAGAVPAVPSLPSLPQASLTVAHSTPPYPVTPPTDEPRRQGTHSGSSPAAYPFPSKRSSLKNLDPETLEALRRLDGLGRSASSVTKGSTRSGRTRASSGAADDATSVKSRPGTPSLVATPERQAGSGWSRSSMPAMPIGPNVLIDDAKADASLSPRSASFAVARSSQGGSSSVSSKRGSASSTTTSPYSTAPSTNTAGTRVSVVGAPKMVRKSSASSDASGAHSDGESIHRDRTTSATGRDELEDIPPVPPLPKAYDLSARSSINQFPSASFGSQAAQLSPATAVVPPTSTVLVATAPPSPSTTVDEPATAVLAPEPDAQTPENEEVLAPLLRRGSSVDDAATDASSVASPRRSATKKWSFSNAFNKLSSAKHSVASTDDGSQPRSPTMPIATIPNPPLERASPQIPWAVGGGEPEGEAPADSGHRASTDSYVMPSPPPQTARRLPSTSSLAPPSSGDSSTAQTPSSSHKRLTPSSIPFFRRSSSQSMNKLATASSSLTGPRPPVPSTPNSSAASTPRKLSSASTQEPAPAAAPSHRKSMLGNMGFSGMLKSSSSRRSLAAAAADPADEFGGAAAGKRPREPSTDAGEKDKGSPGASRLTSSLGLLGRRRGKVRLQADKLACCPRSLDAPPPPQTVSSQDKARDASEQPQPVQAAEAPHQGIPRVASLSRPSPSPATGSGLPQAASSSSLSGSNSIRRQTAVAQPKSNALLRTSRAHLPTISGSPSSTNLSGQAQSFASASAEVGTMSTSSSYSRISDATPTKIPRIASRQSRQLGTPTSAQPSLSRRGSETATLDSFATGLSRAESNLSDFGTLNGEVKAATPAQRFRTTTAASTKADSNEATATRRYSSITSSTSTNSFITRPPRQLPVPPTSSSAAITAAKRLPSSSSLAEPRRLPSSSSVNSGLAAVAASGGSSLATPRTLASKYAATAQPARMTPSSSTNSLATSSSISRSASASPVVIEDDESIGDEEMRQFMKRQRAKKAAHGATSAEIEAMMNYPDPIAPGTAKTPLGALTSCCLLRCLCVS